MKTHPLGRRAIAINSELHKIPGTVIPLIAGALNIKDRPAINDLLDRLSGAIDRVLDTADAVSPQEISGTMDTTWKTPAREYPISDPTKYRPTGTTVFVQRAVKRIRSAGEPA